MKLRIYQVDAFTGSIFSGNPAAIVPLEQWIDEKQMQAIATENNLSETAFFALGEDPLHIRWFTPTTEVELCGHATLAAAHVLSKHMEYRGQSIQFDSQSGPLSVRIESGYRYTLDFPADELRPVAEDLHWKQYFNVPVIDARRGATDYLFRVASEEQVRSATPNFEKLREADGRGFIVTSEGSGPDLDYVARCFYPQAGIDEDPATGSSQTTLAVYWAEKLGETNFNAKQLSKRGGTFETELAGSRVLISGGAKTYLTGHIRLD